MGLMSIALPYAWLLHRPLPVALRQLKAEVLSASIESKSLPLYFSIGSIFLTGTPPRYRLRKMRATAGATSSCTTRVPVASPPPKVRCATRTARRSSSPTGQPLRHTDGVMALRSAGVSCVMLDV